jgi:hypothetical protein
VIYYTVFRILIIKLDLKTPGREDESLVDMADVRADVADEFALKTAGVLGIMRFEKGVVHLLLGLNADQYAAEMCAVLVE